MWGWFVGLLFVSYQSVWGQTLLANSEGIFVPHLSSAPVSPTAGQIYFNTSNDKLMFYNGSLWMEIPGAGAAWTFSTRSTNYTVQTSETHTFFLVSGGITLTLPPAASAGSNFRIKAVTTDNNPAALIPAGGETINGEDIAVLGEKNAAISLISDGSSWYPESYSGATHLGCATGQVVFSTAGTSAWTVPWGCDSITVKAWGAGGGGTTFTATSFGGGGGFASKTLTVTPGESLNVTVGTRGGQGVSAVAGTGGAGLGQGGNGSVVAGTYSAYSGGGGGGGSGVRRSSTVLIVAGGGGGAGPSVNLTGGPGGGASGGAASGCAAARNGGGATQSAVGTTGSGSSGGTPPSGGNGGHAGLQSGAIGLGGGGGGYFGGGAGGGAWGAEYCSGGGGSGYAPSGTLTAGSGRNAANSSDPDYQSGAGQGGSSTESAGHGLVVISYGP